MKRNLLLLVLLVVVSAVAARYLHPGGEKPELVGMRHHMQRALNAVWGTSNNTVELEPGPDGVRARITAFVPPGSGPRRQNWNFPLVRWLAAHHPAIRLSQLQITDGTMGTVLQESTPSVPDSSKENRIAGVTAAPDEATRAELLRRQFQSQLDSALGAGQVLVLVDVVVPSGVVAREAAPMQERAPQGAAPRPFFNREPEPIVEVWLVYDHDRPRVEEQSRQLGTANLRLIEVPAP